MQKKGERTRKGARGKREVRGDQSPIEKKAKAWGKRKGALQKSYISGTRKGQKRQNTNCKGQKKAKKTKMQPARNWCFFAQNEKFQTPVSRNGTGLVIRKLGTKNEEKSNKGADTRVNL